MNIISCTKRLEFDAAHRIIGHDGACRMLHGHRYICEFTFQALKINELGMVIDFAIIKQRINKWLKQFLDHNVILEKIDYDLGCKIAEITGQDIFYLDDKPTAENIGLLLIDKIIPNLFADISDLTCNKIKLYETTNSFIEIIR